MFLKSKIRVFWAPLTHFNIKDDKFIVLGDSMALEAIYTRRSLKHEFALGIISFFSFIYFLLFLSCTSTRIFLIIKI